jgi:serine/threonine-protein kinase
VVTSGGRPPLPEGVFAPYELVRELGARPAGVYAVRQPAAQGAKPHLLAAEYFAGAAKGPDGKESDFVREARRIATITSPNLARVRDVVLRGEDVVVFSEMLDGERLSELWRPDGLPLEIALRAIVDVLSGTAALHSLRDGKQQPMKLAHAEISPVTVALGLDGVARVLHAIARRAPGVQPDPASVGHMAPEVLAGEPFDQRADVFGAGVLLWEVLTGKTLFTETDPAQHVARIRSAPVPPATVPEKAPWAKGLVDVAARALAASPDDRWPTATAMAAELRKAAGLKLAPVSTAAAFAKSAYGERAKTRRQQLETILAMVPAAPAEEAAPISIDVVAASAPPPPPPPPQVMVAPGLPAPLSDVVELSSESLLESSDSLPPPPAAPATGAGLDPFAASAKLAEAPALPPPVPKAAPPVPPEVVPDRLVEPEFGPISGTPAFAAAIVTPPPVLEAPAVLAPPPSPAAEVSDADPSPPLAAGASRNRKFAVLASVGGLGVLMLLLVIARLAFRDTSTKETPGPAPTEVATAPATASTGESPTPVASSAPPPTAPSVALPVASVASAPPAQPPPPPPATTLVAAASPPPPVAARPPPPAAKPPPPAAKPAPPPPPPRPRSKKKPAFDPNSL